VRAVRGREKETLLSGRGLYGVKVEDAVVEERVGGGGSGSVLEMAMLAFVVLVGVRVREGRSGEGRGRYVRGSCCGADGGAAGEEGNGGSLWFLSKGKGNEGALGLKVEDERKWGKR